jgi:activator of 2-hydroxyglutaryl-CoA dehydratase/predicted nucleotide-binding protein (sugar kinase/HSP70/actin superfamily)
MSRYESQGHELGTSINKVGGARFIGIDVGAETIKVVELARLGAELHFVRRQRVEHGKEPGPVLVSLLKQWNWPTVAGAAITGRLSQQARLPQVPIKQAQTRGFRFQYDDGPATIVSIGSHGYSVLELRSSGMEVFRENNRCSQGTGNFLRQLVGRFSLSVGEASELCADVEKSASLSGRCPVILKTDMTHLANKGEDRAAILAGLFDAICKNVMVLIKPDMSPKRVVLIGGVSQSRRIQKVFRESFEALGMSLVPNHTEDALFIEALGSALVASEISAAPPALELLLAPPKKNTLECLPALGSSLPLVHRLKGAPMADVKGQPRRLLVGLDIGSTGSKAVAIDAAKLEVVWEGYRQTNGAPVEAAQDLIQQFGKGPAGHCPVVGFGVTGSGREIVGSLLTTCYGKETVFILNEIAAHAEGALHYDPEVDTIFEIGGQDAKYIRLAEGRVVDCAMNEACSAGTGSFIEEQGGKFSGIRNVVHLGEEALAAKSGVSLGQHCSVFMAEVIDEAVAAGVEQPSIIAGLYDSIVQNYLNRVKGSRSVGQVIFCQGMPFSSDALAAAVARQTGSRVVIPPNPGTVGALGIALLASRELACAELKPLDAGRFLNARIKEKDTFVCASKSGCGGAGNHCRIDRLQTLVDGQSQRFTWGGGCSLYDKGTRKRKLPNLAPDPFRERDDLVQSLVASLTRIEGRPVVALADEFMLKGLFPFFARYFNALGLNVECHLKADQAVLKRGVQKANVPYCAPMQLFHGLTGQMADSTADWLFIPMLREMPRTAGECMAKTCPVAQAAPDIFRLDYGDAIARRILSPVVDCGEGNLDTEVFKNCCRELATQLCGKGADWSSAFEMGRKAQSEFETRCLELGRRALDFCREHNIPPVVVIGRPYTIYNTVLNSNVPSILREQGAIGIPIDCFGVQGETPLFEMMYWGHGQRIMRTAHDVRRLAGVYSVYCSNYSCGPDSFILHFYSHIMEGKPFAIIETDGHSGDAGTKTRVEAFLHCVQQDRCVARNGAGANNFQSLELKPMTLKEAASGGRTLLIPMMGSGARVIEVCFKGIGLSAETLSAPDRDCLRLGRRHTSGKECLPMCTTLGSLLKRMQSEPDKTRRFTYLMPRAQGPCRFGIYNLLNQIALDRVKLRERVEIWSPVESGYFDGLEPKVGVLVYAGLVALDFLLAGLLHSRPVENQPGAAQAIYDSYSARLLQRLEKAVGEPISTTRTLWEVARGTLFGINRLISEAARGFAGICTTVDKPLVLMVGEIYVRSDEFSNDNIVRKLEERGLRVRLAPVNEFMEYVDFYNRVQCGKKGWNARISSWVQRRTQEVVYETMAGPLGWPRRTRVADTLEAVRPYLSRQLAGEAVLTLGNPLHEWKQGLIDAVISVGPLECMPNKIAEAQFFHMAEREGLLSLTLSMNGDPLDTQSLDNFAFEVRMRHERKGRHMPVHASAK